MTIIDIAAVVIVVLTALYFLALAAVALLVPARADRFLQGFADSAGKHYAELSIRLVVGAAFVLQAPHSWFPGAFFGFGGLLLATTACLLMIPWRWHHRFARQTVPRALHFLPLIGVASLVLGALILIAVAHGNAA
jgi:hypothetical protein